MKNKNIQGFSLVIAMFLMIITSLLALYLLEYIIPFSRNTKWMENWTKAYYEANKWIEDVLFSMKWEDAYFETGKTAPSKSIWYYYALISTWKTIPRLWDWTSEFDSNYNKISISNPVQLLIKWIIDWNNINFYFKVPQFDENPSNILYFTWWTSPIINWQLSSDTDTLIASWSHILNSDINPSSWPLSNIIIFDNLRPWLTLYWTGFNMQQFYNNENCSVSWCTLKLSLVNNLFTSTSKKIPYLEYQIDLGINPNVANYYAIIRSSWKSIWYKKDLELYIPQQTTIAAFDFTVFQ